MREIKRLRPTAGPGMRLSYGPNGTTFTPVLKGVPQIQQNTQAELYPFRLGVGTETVTSGSSKTVKFHKVAITLAVDIDGVGYDVVNNDVDSDAKLVGLPLPKAGSGLPWVWMKDAVLTDITDEAANRTTEEVYLHIDNTNHVCVLANTETITATQYTGSDGNTHPFHSDEWIIIGRFDKPSNQQGQYDSTKKPQVLGQYAIGALVWKSVGDRPFDIKRINIGSQSSPVWKTAVYIPTGAVQHDGIANGGQIVNNCTPIPGHDGWYECPNNSSQNEVFLHVVIGDNSSEEEGRKATVLYFKLHNSRVQTGGWPSTTYNMTRFYPIKLGEVNISTNKSTVYHIGPVNFTDDYLDMKWYVDSGGGGGGGGTTVTIQDNREDKSKTGLVGFSGTGPSGEIPLIVENYIGSDLVLVEIDEQQNKKTLDDYLLDTNIDKDNFEEVLGPTITPDEEQERATGEPPPAAPSYHTHQITQLADEEGTPLTDSDTGPETVRDWLEALGIVTSGGMAGPTGEDEVDPVVSESSINFDDASIIKHDAETASPGGGGEDGGLLALADHVHPLNLVETDAATGPTGATAPEPPDPNDYVKPVGSATEEGPSGPVPAPTKASFGTDPHYARVDHIHPMATGATGATGIGTDIPTPTPKTTPIYGDIISTDADFEKQTPPFNQQEWDRDTDEGKKGFKTQMCCGFELYKGVPHFLFREIEIDACGLVRKISKAKMGVMCWYGL